MNKEDKKLQKHLVDETMKVSKTNPDVMFYMEALMKKYEELEQELDKYKNIVDVKTNYIEELLLIIAKSNDYKIQKEVYEKGLEYDKNLKELKGE